MSKPLSPLGEAALSYAADGMFVFPVLPYHKKPPLVSDQFSVSSVDPAQIRAWWSAYPNANIGLDCGKSGVLTIDSDPRNGGDKTTAGLKLLSGGASAWRTRRHRTPGGGDHYLFKAPLEGEDGLRSGSGRFGKGTGV